MIPDEYLTILESGVGEYKEKGSKFVSYSFSIDHEDELGSLITSIKSIHPKARHYCYAYKIGLDQNRFRMHDDGEPSGTAGKPIFGQILSQNLTNVLVIVIRYFGGTKLGVSGLVHAYKEASKEAFSQSKFTKKYLTQTYLITFGYDQMGHILKTLKDLEITILDKVFEEKCFVKIQLRLSTEQIQLIQIRARLLGKSIEEIADNTEINFCSILAIQ